MSELPSYSPWIRFTASACYVALGLLVGVGSFFILVLLTDFNSNEQSVKTSDFRASVAAVEAEAKDLTGLSSLSTEFSREAGLYQLLAQADLEGSLELLNQSANISNPSRRNNTVALILRRITRIDPTAALDQVSQMSGTRESPFLVAVFSEWSQIDLPTAVANAANLDRTQRQQALRAILRTRDDLTNDARREIGLRLGALQQVDAFLATEIVRNQHDPIKAWDLMTSDGVNDSLQLDVFFDVAEASMGLEGLKIVSQLVEQMASWEDPLIVLHTLQYAILEAIYEDPLDAFRQSLRMDHNGGSLVQHMALRAWAKDQPIEAFRVVSTYEPEDVRRNLQKVVLNSWTDNDPRGILQQMDLVPREFRSYVREEVAEALVGLPPNEATSLIIDPENRLLQENIVNRFVQLWLHKDQDTALNWVLSEPALEEMRVSLLYNTLHRIASNDPYRAIELALQHTPPDLLGSQKSPVLSVIDSAARMSVDTALELASLVGEESALSVYSRIGHVLVLRKEFIRAVQLANLVSTEDRSAYERTLILNFGSNYKRELFDHLNELPTHIQSQAAHTVILHNENQEFLQEQELAFAYSLLNPEDLESLTEILAK